MGTSGRTPGGRGVVRRALSAVVAASALVLAGLATGALAAPAAAATGDDPLYLVTLEGPGMAGYHGVLPTQLRLLQLGREQDRLLAGVEAPRPVYRWTTALNGFAVRLSDSQAEALAAEPEVALVEPNTVRTMAGATAAATGLLPARHDRGGAGAVIGFVDSGIWPGSPLFAAVPGLGREPSHFSGSCAVDPDWPTGTCNRKLVGARWFVDGFGADRLRSASSLSPRDTDGHGTEMASIAAGNAGVSVRVGTQRLGTYGGVAPQARVAVYKACWNAPDPTDDGCATADLVSAIDAATADGVDILNLSVSGSDDPSGTDTVERALLGAAEADVVAVAAAGNATGRAFSSHPDPWVTTVGATTGAVRRGRVQLGSGPDLRGAMASTRGVGPAPVVVGAQVAAPDATRAQARVCTPGSLDASQVSGTIVLCERGGIGRVDKSAAVAQADGVGMVLINVARGTVDADFHSVPTVHLGRPDGVTLRRWLHHHPRGTVALQPLGLEQAPARVARGSAGGDPTGGVLKPDVVAPGVGVLGAVPPSVRSSRWDFVTGTSAATAFTSGAAALLVQRHGWSAAVIRSALATSAARVADSSAFEAGAGRVRPRRATEPTLAYEVAPGDYRAWLTGSLAELNTPSVLISGRRSSARRTITNVGHRALYFSSSTSGFTRHHVTVTPAAVRLAPGDSATFTVEVSGNETAQPLDDGWVTWLGANGSRSRIPVAITR